jgi:hypothetical protein
VVREKTFLVRRNRAGEVRQRCWPQRAHHVLLLASGRAPSGLGALVTHALVTCRSGFSDWAATPRMEPAEVGVHTLLRPAHHTTRASTRKCAHPSLFHHPVCHRSFALALCFNSKLCAWQSVLSSRLRLNATLVFVLQLVARGRARSRALQGAQRRCMSSPRKQERPNVNSMTHSHPSQPSPVA